MRADRTHTQISYFTGSTPRELMILARHLRDGIAAKIDENARASADTERKLVARLIITYRR